MTVPASPTTFHPNSANHLPPSPQNLLYRDHELRQAVSSLLPQRMNGNLAIIGPPGVGKSTLALAVLHHQKICATFSTRLFIDCTLHNPVTATLMALDLAAKQLPPTLPGPGRTLLLLDGFNVPCYDDNYGDKDGVMDTSVLLHTLCMTTPQVTVVITTCATMIPSSHFHRQVLYLWYSRSVKRAFIALCIWLLLLRAIWSLNMTSCPLGSFRRFTYSISPILAEHPLEP